MQRLFEHESRSLALQVDEALLRPAVADREPEDVAVEGATACDVRAEQFGNECWRHALRMALKRRAPLLAVKLPVHRLGRKSFTYEPLTPVVRVMRDQQRRDGEPGVQAPRGARERKADDADRAVVDSLTAQPHARSIGVVVDVDDRAGHAPTLRSGALRRKAPWGAGSLTLVSERRAWASAGGP